MNFYPVCNFPVQPVDKINDFIIEHLSDRKPFSLVRLGDGEGVLLSLSENSQIGDFQYLAQHFGGYGIRLHQLLLLKKMLTTSISKADVVGIRDDILEVGFADHFFDLPPKPFIEKFRKYFTHCKKGMPYSPARRIALLHQALTQIAFRPEQKYSSCWIHFDLHLSGHIFHILSREKRIGLITSKPSVTQKLSELFESNIQLHEIPEKFEADRYALSGAHFPRRFFQLKNEIKVEFEGMLFLVAAGLCGKIYCEWIRNEGGIAIDTGALLDAWVGIASRPAFFSTRFNNSLKENGVPIELLLNQKNVDRLIKKTVG